VKRILPAILCCFVAATAGAQSLRGSKSSVQKMYTRAVRSDLDFFSTSKGIYESVRDGELVMLSITMDMTLDGVSYPFVLPRTRDVLLVFANKYHQACGERLVVTSAARPRREQPRNASPKSVHPTGMAIDFRKPAGNCLTYLRKELMLLEKEGVLEATEERHPVHFHVAVLQRGKFAPAAAAVATATSVTAPQRPTMTIAATPAASVTMDSAGGSVEPSPPTPAPKKAAAPAASKPRTYAVRKGDNLSEIAKRFGLTVSRLKSLNGLKGSMIRPGQKLRIR
jgi:LysM repeat protein